MPQTRTQTHTYVYKRGHTNHVLRLSAAILQADTGPPTLVVEVGKVDRLDGVEALLEISGGLFDDISGGQVDGPSVLQVDLALEEEHEQPHRQITCGEMWSVRCRTTKRMARYIPQTHTHWAGGVNVVVHG